MQAAQLQHLQRSPLAGRGVVHLMDGSTFEGWVLVSGGTLTIDGRLRVSSGPSYRYSYSYRRQVRRTYPVRAIRCVEWAEAGQ